MYAYVGTRTTRERNARGEGISVFRYDPLSADLQLLEVVGDLTNPSFLTLNSSRNRLYCVHGDMSEVSAFAVNPSTGGLTFINQQSTQGQNPVHLALDPSERWIVVSNHIGASLAVLPIAADGSLEPMSQLVSLEGTPGPHRIEQKHAKPHFNPFDPSGRYVVVPDKGLDRIFTFRFQDGQLMPASSPFVETREGAGPRHIAFHPHLSTAYCVNELDSTVTAYRFDAGCGKLTPLQILPALPACYTGNSRAAAIAVSPDGRRVYSSNRGHDSIAVFQVALETGLLEFVGATKSGGRTPRFTTLAPDGHHFFALNEESDTIVTFAVEPHDGALSMTGQMTPCASPVCMVFA
jgi:6-phosphogluconolactonase